MDFITSPAWLALSWSVVVGVVGWFMAAAQSRSGARGGAPSRARASRYRELRKRASKVATGLQSPIPLEREAARAEARDIAAQLAAPKYPMWPVWLCLALALVMSVFAGITGTSGAPNSENSRVVLFAASFVYGCAGAFVLAWQTLARGSYAAIHLPLEAFELPGDKKRARRFQSRTLAKRRLRQLRWEEKRLFAVEGVGG